MTIYFESSNPVVRNFYVKSRAFIAALAFNFNVAAVKFDDLADERDTEVALLAVVKCRELTAQLENVRQKFRGDTAPGVADFYLRSGIQPFRFARFE
jgi:hypothetical protein